MKARQDRPRPLDGLHSTLSRFVKSTMARCRWSVGDQRSVWTPERADKEPVDDAGSSFEVARGATEAELGSDKLLAVEF